MEIPSCPPFSKWGIKSPPFVKGGREGFYRPEQQYVYLSCQLRFGPLTLTLSPWGIGANLRAFPMFSPLFQRGGRGDFCIQLSYKGPIDRFYNSITFFQNFSTVKAQYF